MGYQENQLSKIGEFGLIEQVITPKFREMWGKDVTGIGDDCAIMPLSDGKVQVVTTDMLVEGIHFLHSGITAFQLGYKSLTANLSDIAAMGATPSATFLSIAFTEDLEVDWIEEFMEGYKALSQQEQVPLLGGDTTKTPDKIIVNVAVTGSVKKDHVKRRSAAMPGDYIVVPDNIGDSAGGLQYLLDGPDRDEYSESLLKQHLQPDPKVKEGQWLAQKQKVHAVMDISDGISSDVQHILKASNVAAELYIDKVPVSDNLKAACEKHGWDITKLTFTVGEDYTLLFTVDAEGFDEIARSFEASFGRPLYVIGKITHGKPEVQYFRNGQRSTEPGKGYRHF